ncbi:hypothetical protein VTK73DRAFT_1087 [Phialemonium thermophilum]|uniref:Zn(2)-C6 fungal-type domain-containing protein n=1 Tax=Phialemonium thermophilum TaxID=223376 RepID=A0ABR3XAX9_9PEZI
MDPDGSPSATSSSCRPLGAPRSRNGCQQCRKRKRKCDEHHPRCLACVDRGLPCDWGREPRQPQVARRRHHVNKDFTVPQEMRPLVTVFAAPSQPIQERLLSYFSTNSPLWLTSSGDTTACSDVIVPIALQNPVVYNCILALAAGDLAKYQPASSEMANLTYGFYGQAVAGINLALASESQGDDVSLPNWKPDGALSQNNDDLLLAILLLCVHESVNFTSINRILPHLNAAATLCHRRCYSGVVPDARLRGLLFEIFCYIFTLTAFSHGHHLALHLAPEIFTSPCLSDGLYKGVLLGQHCRPIFWVILRMSILGIGISALPQPSESTAHELLTFADQLEAYQTAWDDGDSSISQDEAKVSELYRLACLVHIKKTLDPWLPDWSDEIQGLVGRFIRTLNILPPTSPANNILCWPLFIAGMSSVAVSHQRLIIGRLRRNYESRWRSDILSQTADFLSKKWKRDKSLTSEGCRPASGNPAGPVSLRPGPEFPVVLL